MRKIVAGVAGATFALTLGFAFKPVVASAARVDCAKVLSELHSGKKPKAVAHDLKISTSSVYRCRRRSHMMATSPAKKMSHMMVSPAAMSSPAAASK